MESEYRLDVKERLMALPFIVWLLIFLLMSGRSSAQEPFIYPAKGQSQAQQDKDRYECHTWAAQQTGFGPTNPQTATSDAAASRRYQPSQPHVLKGAARGAALGAVGGAIAGDAGKGAGAGAAMGGLAGGFRRRDERKQQANAQASDTSAAASNQHTSYNRAMAACLQGRGYTVN
jgi:hypothetical protein